MVFMSADKPTVSGPPNLRAILRLTPKPGVADIVLINSRFELPFWGSFGMSRDPLASGVQCVDKECRNAQKIS